MVHELALIGEVHESASMGETCPHYVWFHFVILKYKIKRLRFVFFSSRWVLHFPAIALYFGKACFHELPSNAISMVFYKRRTLLLIQHSKGDL